MYKLQTTPPFTRSGLLKALGIPPNSGRESLKTLLNKGFIEATQQHWHPGPPHYSFRFRPTAAFPGGHDDSATSPHPSRIAQLLEWNESPPESRHHQLTIAQRLLLMLLLATASRCGVVESLSQNELARQLGTTSPRIRYECNNLKRYGYIRRVIDGGNFERLLGRRKSIYFLELHHESYGDHKSAGSTIIAKRIATDPIKEAFVAYRPRQRQRAPRETSDMPDRPALQLAALLATNRRTNRSRHTGVRDDEIHQLLRLIDRLAEWSLRQYGEQIDPVPPSDLIKTIYAAIGNQLGQPDDEAINYAALPETYLSPIMNSYKVANNETVADYFVLTDTDDHTDIRTDAQAFLVVCVLARLKMALSALRKAGRTINPNTNYLILPYPKRTDSQSAFCVETYPDIPHSINHEIISGLSDPDDPISSLEDLPMSLLEATSLRTLPLEYPRLKRPPSSQSDNNLK